jgi:hypothetical protein
MYTTNKYQQKTKKIAAASMDGTMKRRRPCTTWEDEVEEDLSIMGIKKRQDMTRDRRE